MIEKTDDRQENLKTGFDGWLKTLESNERYRDCNVDTVLRNIGINVESIYEIEDPQNIRLYASELVMKRPLCAEVKFTSYSRCIDHLLAYAEYLDHPEKITLEPETRLEATVANGRKRKESATDENSKLGISLTVAYYLSRVNKKALQELGYRSFNDAFKDLAEKLDQKPATIKNMRDEFDPYFDNGRRGWYQRELRASRKDIFEINKDLTDEELTIKVKNMLTGYMKDRPAESYGSIDISESEHKNSVGDRVKLKIDPSNYKSIKYSNKQKNRN